MDPRTNIMTRKSRISKLVRIAFKPPIESFDFGSSRSMSIWKIRVNDYFGTFLFLIDSIRFTLRAQNKEIPMRMSAMMNAAR